MLVLQRRPIAETAHLVILPWPPLLLIPRHRRNGLDLLSLLLRYQVIVGVIGQYHVRCERVSLRTLRVLAHLVDLRCERKVFMRVVRRGLRCRKELRLLLLMLEMLRLELKHVELRYLHGRLQEAKICGEKES